MKNKVRYLIIFSACIVIGLVAIWGVTQKQSDRPTISVAQRALDTIQIQNTMSKVLHYHNANRHDIIFNEILAKNPPTPITFANQSGVWVGRETIKKFFVDANDESMKRNLEEISKVLPEVKNVPENLGVGSWIAHTQTTPIIEVAGDGKTAKGVWYSPGASLSTSVRDGKLVTSGTWFWEKYAVDFIKEDGKWKIWHQHMFYDVTAPIGSNWAEQRSQQVQRELGEDEEKQQAIGIVPPTRPPIDTYTQWSPTRVPQVAPRLPEPYYTFSETFSYEYE